MRALCAEARRRWPDLGRIALHHRVGRLAPCELAVLVAVAAPHREAAFEAARWCIDTLKATVPIWKYETWSQGAAWSACDTPLEAVADRARPGKGDVAKGDAPTGDAGKSGFSVEGVRA